MKKIYLFAVFLLLNACSNLPPAIVNPPVFDLSYSQAMKNINGLKNTPVRWGGIIAGVQNEQNFSLVEILYYPLDGDGRPMIGQAAAGRFLAKRPEFLDPLIYSKDTLVTVAGTLQGDMERTIGNKSMRLPLLAADIIYMWPDYDYCDPYAGFGYGYNPYFGPYPYYWGGYRWPYSGPLTYSVPCVRRQ